RRAYVRLGAAGYITALLLVTVVLAALPVALTIAEGGEPFVAGALGLLALFPASALAIALVNLHVVSVLGPERLPRLSLEDGVPRELRTLVAIPTMLNDEEQVR